MCLNHMLYTDMHSLERMILPLARKPSELCLQLSVLPDVGTFVGLHDSFFNYLDNIRIRNIHRANCL